MSDKKGTSPRGTPSPRASPRGSPGTTSPRGGASPRGSAAGSVAGSRAASERSAKVSDRGSRAGSERKGSAASRQSQARPGAGGKAQGRDMGKGGAQRDVKSGRPGGPDKIPFLPRNFVFSSKGMLGRPVLDHLIIKDTINKFNRVTDNWKATYGIFTDEDLKRWRFKVPCCGCCCGCGCGCGSCCSPCCGPCGPCC